MRRFLLPAILLVSLAVGSAFVWSWYRSTHAERLLVLGTGARGSEYYIFGEALARIVDRRLPRLSLRVIETYGADENLTLLADGTYDIALVSAATVLPAKIRVVDFLFPEVYHLIARRDAGIASVGDLAGRVVGLMPAGSGTRPLFAHLLGHYGLAVSDVKTVSLLPNEAAAAFSDGIIDAYFIVIAVDMPVIEQLVREAPVELVAIDQAAALKLSLPVLEPAVIPKGAYDGGSPKPPADLPGVAIRTLMVARADTDPKDIYDLVEVIHESRSEFVQNDLRMALMEPVTSPLSQGLAMHEGAKDYYLRDEPLFIVEYAETMGFLLSASIFVLSALWHVKVQAERRSKNRADFYNSSLIRLAERAHAAQSIEDLQTIRGELFQIFPRLFDDLDHDRVSQTSLQGITLACQVVTQAVQAKEAQLGDRAHDHYVPPPRQRLAVTEL